MLPTWGRVLLQFVIPHKLILTRDVGCELCEFLAIQALHCFFDFGQAHATNLGWPACDHKPHGSKYSGRRRPFASATVQAASHRRVTKVASEARRSVFSPLLIFGADVHPESAPAEVEETLRLIGDELRGDLEEAAARVDDDAGFAQDGELLGNDGGAPAGPLRDLGDHERAAVGQLAQDVPASGAADAGENGFQAQSRRRCTGGFRHGGRMSCSGNRRQALSAPASAQGSVVRLCRN